MNKKVLILVGLIALGTVLIANASITNIKGPPPSIIVTAGDTFSLTWEMDLSVSDALVAVNIPTLSSELSYTRDSFNATINGFDNKSSFVDNSSVTDIAISTRPGNATLPDLSTGPLILTIPIRASGAPGSYDIDWMLTTGDTETWPFQTTGTTTVISAIPICKVFLTPKKVNVKKKAEHSFKIHVYPCEPMNVSVGDLAEVYVDDEKYDAIVSSTDKDGEATDIAIKVYVPDLIDNDPTVAIYSINDIYIAYSDELGGGVIDDLVLDTFTPGKKFKRLKQQ